MRIGIDAFALNQPHNGIGQVTTHVVNAFQELKASLPGTAGQGIPLSTAAREQFKRITGTNSEFFLYVTEELPFQLPDFFHARVLSLKPKLRTLSKKWWETTQLPRAVSRDGCDILISLYQSATVMSPSFPHLMLVHDIIYALEPHFADKWHKRLSLWLTLRGVRRASHCVTVSHYTKQDMIRNLGMADSSISVAHIAADPVFALTLSTNAVEAVLQKYKLAPGYLYHGGGFARRKNAQGVLEAYALLVEESRQGKLAFPLPELVISGQMIRGVPNATDVERICEALNLSEHVRLLGCVPQSDLPALYRGASVFLYPSHYEGFGLPVLEAMHQGVPVIAANTSSLPEVGGDAALYCHPDRPAAMVALIKELHTNPGEKELRGQMGLKRSAEFTWDSFMQELLNAMEIVLSRHHPAG